jgi:hypothetical protein
MTALAQALKSLQVASWLMMSMSLAQTMNKSKFYLAHL